MTTSDQRSSTNSSEATVLSALRLLSLRPELSQRQISAELGLSLGKTHYVVHALLDRGWVKIQNFRRSDNKLAYLYLLTPSGAAAKLRMTRDFLAAKEDEYEALRREIQLLRTELPEESVPQDRASDAAPGAPPPPDRT